MIAVLGTTITAMSINTWGFIQDENWLLATIGSILLVLAVWLIVEGALALRRFIKSGRTIEDLAVFPEDS